MMANILYYSCTPLSREQATTVFKFYEDEDLPPERYKVNVGWISDQSLYELIASGDLSDDEKISEEEAGQIIKRLEDNA